MPPFVLAISGSPSPTSRTALFADLILDMMAREGASIDHVRLSSVDPAAIVTGNIADPGVANLNAKLAAASGIVIATPIFKASCSGLLKAALDVMPQFGLAGKVILPVATGGSLAHVLALDYGLRPVLQSMGARHIVQSYFLCEQDARLVDGQLELGDFASKALAPAIRNFMYSLTTDEDVRLLGHPRPEEARA